MVDVIQTSVRWRLQGRVLLLAVSVVAATILATAAPAAAEVPPPVGTTPAPPTETAPTETTPAPSTTVVTTPTPTPPVGQVTTPPKTEPPGTTITIKVPRLRSAKPKRVAAPATKVEPTVTTPATQPVWRPPVVAAAVPAPAQVVKPAKKPKPQTAAKRGAPRSASGTALGSAVANPFATRPWTAPTTQVSAAEGTTAVAPLASAGEGIRFASELLILLGLGGVLLIAVAGAAPALARHWPSVFAPVVTRRAGTSSVGLSFLVTVLLTWMIAGSGA